MNINATQFKNQLGQYMESAMKEPVIIEKSGRPRAVLVSFDDYQKLALYEDFYWSEKAKEAEKEGFLGTTKTAAHLKKYAKRAGIGDE